MSIDELFNDSRLASLDKEKINLLKKLSTEIGELKSDEKLPFFIALSQSDILQKLNFSKDETTLLLDVIKDNDMQKDFQKIETLLRLFSATT